MSYFDDSAVLISKSDDVGSGLSSSQWVLVMVLVQLAGCGCCVSIVILVYLKLKETKRRRKRTVEHIEKGYKHRERKRIHPKKMKEKERVRVRVSEEKYNSSVTGSPESGQSGQSGQSTTNAMRHKIESFSDGGDGYLMQHDREEENECEAMMNVLVEAEFARPKTPRSPRPPYKMREEIPGSPGEYGGADNAYDGMEERQRLQVRKEKVRNSREVRKTRGVSEDMYGRPKREDEPTPMLNAQNGHSGQSGRPRTPDHAMYGGKGTKGKGKGKASMSSMASREIIFFDECGDEMSSESPDTSGSEIWNAAQCEKEKEEEVAPGTGTGTEEEELMDARSSTPMLTLPTHKVTKSQWM